MPGEPWDPIEHDRRHASCKRGGLRHLISEGDLCFDYAPHPNIIDCLDGEGLWAIKRSAIHFQGMLTDCPNPKSFIIGYGEYWDLNLRSLNPTADRRMRELSLTGLFDIGVPQREIRTVHLRVESARDLARENATWTEDAASASIGTSIQRTDAFYSLSAILRTAVSASDLRGPRTSEPRPAFGFHSADLEMDLKFRSRIATFGSTTTLQLATALRARRLRSKAG